MLRRSDPDFHPLLILDGKANPQVTLDVQLGQILARYALLKRDADDLLKVFDGDVGPESSVTLRALAEKVSVVFAVKLGHVSSDQEA